MTSDPQSFPGSYPLGFAPRRSVMDPETGNPLISSAPTGQVRQRAGLLPIGRDDSGALVPAVPQGLFDAIDAARFPGQVLRGEKGVFDPETGHTSDEAMGAATGLAGLAMTGSLPFKAPKGALRSFGGAVEKDDPLAAMQAIFADLPTTPPTPRHSLVDPAAKSWDLYHGTAAPKDFQRFGVNLPDDMRPNTAGSPQQAEAIFMTPAPDEAAHYALGRGKTGEGVEAGPRTIRATVDPGKTQLFDLPHLIENDPGFRETIWQTGLDNLGKRLGPINPAREKVLRNEFERQTQEILDDLARTRAFNEEYAHLGVSEMPQVNYFYGGADAAIRRAKDQGLDTAVIRGLNESHGGDQVVALTPGRVRSFYDPDHVLYSGGRGGALAGAGGLSARAGAAPSTTQDQPMSAGPTAGLGNLSPEDFAAIFGNAPPGAGPAPRRIPFGLNPGLLGLGAGSPEQAATAGPSFGAGSQMPDAPQMPPAPVQRQPAPAAPQAARAITPAPLPPPRPAEFGASAADMPAPNAVPTSGQAPSPAAPGAEEPSFLDGLMRGIQKTDGLLGSIGIGLLSTPGMGQGLAAGLRNHQQAGVQKAATNLAQAEFQLKQRKLQQETAQEDKKAARENMTAKVIANKLGISLDQATAFAGNPEFVNGFLRNGYGAPDGYTRGPDGTLVAVPGGEKDPSVIRARAQATAEGAAAGGKDDVQLVTRPDGSIVAVNKSQIGEPGASAAAVTPVVSGGSKLEAEAAERRKAVVAQGGDVNDPRYKDYILSGSLPKENQQQLTAADKQAIREGEDNILSHRNALGQLRRGLDLSPKAYEGVTAGGRAMLMTNLPQALGGGSEAAMATREFDNTMSTQMLDSLKAIFGGNPTEGERAALKDIQGISSMPQELREKVIRNTIAKVESRLGFEEQRVGDLRGGTYYKPRTGEPAAPQASASPEAGDPLAAARAAIAQGADANKVKTRLLKAGIDPKGL